MSTHALSVVITTKDTALQRDVQYSFVLQTKHPRWELVKILLRVLFTMRFR
ncbi:MAG TPA: hypothetical protein VNL69_01855 [Bacteroidota bacterium]|nr:hypothetical protein [Bacteroidota bacterium]